MSSALKPIKVYGAAGPNPPKVALVLRELDIPCEILSTGFAELKQPEFLAINPNGRIPAMYDPNTDITLWESGAILEYIIERYDKDQKLSFAPGSKESYLAKQWLFFQVSGQGPYYGQAMWFFAYHPEKIPSAVERYIKEINRVTAVLEGHLAKQESGGDGPWLVGNKLSYVDLSFLMWQTVVPRVFKKDQYDESKYPNVAKWVANMMGREKVAKVMEDAAEAQKTAHKGYDPNA